MLKATWLDPFHVLVSGLDGERLAEVPVTRPWKKNDLRYVLKHDGNTKTEGVIGIVNMISQGCFRAYTGFPQSDRACYVTDGKGGCYANQTRHAQVRAGGGFNVIHNGARPGTEEWFRIQVPTNLEVPAEIKTKMYRVDSETADGSMSLALGLVQDFAEQNPSRMVATISSAYFDVPEFQIERARETRVTVGFTVSPWFSPEEIEHRIRQLDLFLDSGVSSVVWVATNPDWETLEHHDESMMLVREAISRVPAEAVIEVPYHDASTHEFARLGVNPRGACCDNRYDSKGRRVDIESWTVIGERGDEEKPSGRVSGRCKGCPIACGMAFTKKAAAAAA
jgi:hypothetical protein